MAFLEGKSGMVKMNDFLKSLWPIAVPPLPPAYIDPQNMRKLRHDLRELEKEGKIRLSPHVLQLGKTHFPDQSTGIATPRDLTNTIIEVEPT